VGHNQGPPIDNLANIVGCERTVACRDLREVWHDSVQSPRNGPVATTELAMAAGAESRKELASAQVVETERLRRGERCRESEQRSQYAAYVQVVASQNSLFTVTTHGYDPLD
jgi:hypothetical protein